MINKTNTEQSKDKITLSYALTDGRIIRTIKVFNALGVVSATISIMPNIHSTAYILREVLK